MTSGNELIKIIPTHMIWDGNKIRDLRLRMGWSRADLARRLQLQPSRVGELEMDLEIASLEVGQSLDLLEKQADVSAESVFYGALSESIFIEDSVPQVDTTAVRRKFVDL